LTALPILACLEERGIGREPSWSQPRNTIGDE
jgi:hypothetical protein